MSGKFDLGDYISVDDRLALFFQRFPEGSLATEYEWSTEQTGWVCRVTAYRTPDDPAPGVGVALEPVPGKTPYTKDSELMNAETSARGRAVLAVMPVDKGGATREEVAARQEPPIEPRRADMRDRLLGLDEGVVEAIVRRARKADLDELLEALGHADAARLDALEQWIVEAMSEPF